jgi:hypothetical protein
MEDINVHRIEVFHPTTHPSDDPETQKEAAEMIVGIFYRRCMVRKLNFCKSKG